MIILTAAANVGGCDGSRQYRPVETNQQAAGDPDAISRPVEDIHARDIRRAFADMVTDFEPTDPPTRGPARGRWADVPHAAQWAVADAELAIMSQVLESESWEFTLLTLDERPGQLIVSRAPAPELWEASARIGLFPDRQPNLDHAERLLEAFADRMAQLARQLRFESQD